MRVGALQSSELGASFRYFEHTVNFLLDVTINFRTNIGLKKHYFESVRSATQFGEKILPGNLCGFYK